MSTEQITFHLTYASVDAGGETDPTEAAEKILRDERVLAAVGEFDDMELLVIVPVTESGRLITLADDGTLRFDLDAAELRATFADAGLQIQLGLDDDLDEMDAELDEQFADDFEALDDPASSPDDPADDFDFEPDPVLVAEFSRRGPWGARMTAQLVGTDVDYLEAGTWSVYRYRSSEPHSAVTSARSELPVIEVNVPTQGTSWIEVTAAGGGTAFFWVNSARLMRPVLALDDIAVPESADVYRRILAEAGDISEELAELGMNAGVDVERAVRACLPESVGGTKGEWARLREFVAAFGVPETLIESGLDETEAGRRFTARGWPRMLGDYFMAGVGEAIPLTRRDGVFARLSSFLRKRPLLSASVSTAELATGVALSRGRGGLGRVVGVALVIDALVDLYILWRRVQRRR